MYVRVYIMYVCMYVDTDVRCGAVSVTKSDFHSGNQDNQTTPVVDYGISVLR